MNNCYDRAIRKMANAVTSNIKKKTTFHEGTYAMLCGPNFGKQNMYIIQYEKMVYKYQNYYRNVLIAQFFYHLETIAELRMLKVCGVDAVGNFSTHII